VVRYLTGSTHSVSFSGTKSIWTIILCGVLQGSVLGPLLFILCAADVIAIAQRHGFQVHSYADDTQFYFHDKAESCERRLPRFTECIAAIESWMTANRLKMNTDKTDFIWLGSKHPVDKIHSQTIALEAVHVPVSSVVTCLGFQFDSHLTFIPNVHDLARRFYHLWQLLSVRLSLTTDSAKTLVHALIASRLDYCNSVLYQMNIIATKIIQSVLHSAARLIMQKRKFERMTPTLRDDLHWLPVRERIVFKLCSIIFKRRHQTAPQYLQWLCVPATASTSRRHLRSAARGDLQVLACRTSSLKPRSLAACAPKLWNYLHRHFGIQHLH